MQQNCIFIYHVPVKYRLNYTNMNITKLIQEMINFKNEIIKMYAQFECWVGTLQ